MHMHVIRDVIQIISQNPMEEIMVLPKGNAPNFQINIALVIFIWHSINPTEPCKETGLFNTFPSPLLKSKIIYFTLP